VSEELIPTPETLNERTSPRPEIDVDKRGRFHFTWNRLGVSAVVSGIDRRRHELVCDIGITTQVPLARVHTRVNLMSTSARTALRRELEHTTSGNDQLDWQKLLQEMQGWIHQKLTEGRRSNAVGYSRDARQTDLMVAPLIARGEETFISADGGTGKTTLMIALAAQYQTGHEIIPGFAVKSPGNALFCNWEAGEEIFQSIYSRILEGAGLHESGIKVQHMECGGLGAVDDQVDTLIREIDEYEIELAFIDSASWAAPGDLESQDTVGRYEAAIKALDVTTVHIAHLPKEGDPSKPFGSVFWHNYARSSWIARKQNEPGGQQLAIGMFNAKSNYRATSEPLGIRLDFRDGLIRFHREDLANVPGLDKGVPLIRRIEKVLLDGTQRTPAEVAEELDEPSSSVRSAISKNRDRFVRDDNGYYAMLAHDRPMRAAAGSDAAAPETDEDPLW